MLEKYFSLLAALMMKGDNFFKGKARSRNRWSMVQYCTMVYVKSH